MLPKKDHTSNFFHELQKNPQTIQPKLEFKPLVFFLSNSQKSIPVFWANIFGSPAGVSRRLGWKEEMSEGLYGRGVMVLDGVRGVGVSSRRVGNGQELWFELRSKRKGTTHFWVFILPRFPSLSLVFFPLSTSGAWRREGSTKGGLVMGGGNDSKRWEGASDQNRGVGSGCADSSTLSSVPSSTGGYASLHTLTYTNITFKCMCNIVLRPSFSPS